MFRNQEAVPAFALGIDEVCDIKVDRCRAMMDQNTVLLYQATFRLHYRKPYAVSFWHEVHDSAGMKVQLVADRFRYDKASQPVYGNLHGKMVLPLPLRVN